MVRLSDRKFKLNRQRLDRAWLNFVKYSKRDTVVTYCEKLESERDTSGLCKTESLRELSRPNWKNPREEVFHLEKQATEVERRELTVTDSQHESIPRGIETLRERLLSIKKREVL